MADGEVARVVFEAEGPDGVPTSQHTVYGAVEADRPFAVEGECVGDRLDFTVVSATSDPQTLVDGVLECGASDPFGYTLPYDGAVQILLGPTDGIERAWLRVRSED